MGEPPSLAGGSQDRVMALAPDVADAAAVTFCGWAGVLADCPEPTPADHCPL